MNRLVLGFYASVRSVLTAGFLCKCQVRFGFLCKCQVGVGFLFKCQVGTGFGLKM